MKLRSIVWKELWQRPTAMIASGLAILLGVAALVAMRHVTVCSGQEVARQLNQLGANVLILPEAASVADYYAADSNGSTLPEEHVDRIVMAALTGVEKLSPKLCVPAKLAGRPLTLCGILPQSELTAKAAWQTAALFRQPHAGCTRAHCGPAAESGSPGSLATARTIERLAGDEVVVGADVAAREDLQAGDSVALLGGKFRVLAVLPATGTVDDGRCFAHLHRVQQLSGAGQVVSAIEVMGCCEDAAGGLVPQLAELVPGGKVVTIGQVVETQRGVHRLFSTASTLVLGALVLVGGASVLSTISSDVRTRRREIGTLVALGATPGFVVRVFLLKALWLGLLGGIGGALVGMIAAVWLVGRWAQIPIVPLPAVVPVAVALAVVVALVAAWWPARQASRLDPCVCFREG